MTVKELRAALAAFDGDLVVLMRQEVQSGFAVVEEVTLQQRQTQGNLHDPDGSNDPAFVFLR